MLVLSRKHGERILIGDDVVVTIVRIGPANVRVGIDAPRETRIVREELEQGGGDRETSNLHSSQSDHQPAADFYASFYKGEE